MIKVAHSWPSRVLLEALAPHHVLRYHQGFERALFLQGEEPLFNMAAIALPVPFLQNQKE